MCALCSSVTSSLSRQRFSYSPRISQSPPPKPEPPELNDGSCCDDCSCDTVYCFNSGTCCPDTLDYLPNIDESLSRIKRECVDTYLKKKVSSDTPVGNSVWMTTKCANDFNDTVQIILRDKCENPEQFTDVDTKIPVTDNITHDIYRNMYCALCNFVVEEKMVYWDASVECSKAVLLPSSMKQIVEEVNEIPECNIIYKHPKMEGNLPECTYKITECNVTGNWEVYDPVVEAACHAYTAVFDFKYNNIFCYLCNEPGFSAPGVALRRQIIM